MCIHNHAEFGGNPFINLEAEIFRKKLQKIPVQKLQNSEKNKITISLNLE